MSHIVASKQTRGSVRWTLLGWRVRGALSLSVCVFECVCLGGRKLLHREALTELRWLSHQLTHTNNLRLQKSHWLWRDYSTGREDRSYNESGSKHRTGLSEEQGCYIYPPSHDSQDCIIIFISAAHCFAPRHTTRGQETWFSHCVQSLFLTSLVLDPHGSGGEEEGLSQQKKLLMACKYCWCLSWNLFNLLNVPPTLPSKGVQASKRSNDAIKYFSSGEGGKQASKSVLEFIGVL